MGDTMTIQTVTKRVRPLAKTPASFKLNPATLEKLKDLSKATSRSQAGVLDDLILREHARVMTDTDARLRQVEERLARLEAAPPPPPDRDGGDGQQ